MWSWGLAVLGLVGLYLTWQIGNGRRWPWLGQVFIALPWFIYAASTAQWGFLVTTALTVAINFRNWRHH